MQNQKKIKKLILRNIQVTDILKYVTPQYQKKQLNYPQNCIQNIKCLSNELIAIDCQMVDTQLGSELVRITIVNQNQCQIYDKWFLPKGKNIQYLTHINGITQTILLQKAKKIYDEQDQQQIVKLIKDKIMVGHDLANDLNVLKIQHHTFIDTVALLPHNFGLPFKNKLKNLAMEILRIPIQWDSHDPTQDAVAALRIVKDHVKLGKGTVQQIEMEGKRPCDYQDVWQIMKQAQLQKQKIVALFLRGSRALDLTIETEDYTSDWDYVCVYNTHSPINGRLIKLPQIDISLFDIHTFNIYLKNNDISYMQMFFLPQQCQFINKLSFPEIKIQSLRQSLGYHLSKGKMKMARFKGDQTKSWKILKCVHLKMRFINQFMQYLKYGSIKDIKAMNPLWIQIKEQFIKTGNLQNTLKQANTKVNSMLKELRQNYQSKRKLRYLDKCNKKQKLQKQSQESLLDSESFQAQEQQFIIRETRIRSRGRTKRIRYESQQCSLSQNLQYSQELSNQKNEQREYLLKKSDKNMSFMKKKYISQKQQDNIKLYKPTFPMQFQNSSGIKPNPFHQKLALVRQLQQNGYDHMDQYKIIYKRGTKFPNLVQFHYLQSASFYHQICREARGIILDQNKNFEVVALPYWKFFDYNDPKYSEVKKFDFSNYKVYEKHDGSIAMLYYYGGEWQVGSAKIPDGESNYCFARKQTTTMFRHQFWKIFKQLDYKLPTKQDINKTFIFQLMSKNHIIVVNRDKSDLVLHGVRNIDTLQEENFQDYAKKYDWKPARKIQLDLNPQQDQLSQIVNITEKLNPTEQEGYILIDKNFIRLKVKNSGYVRINWLGQLNMTINKDPSRYILVEIVLSGQAETFCKYCPQWEKLIMQYLQRIKKLNHKVSQIYDQLKKLNLNDKQFAHEVHKNQKQIHPFLFSIRRNQNLYYGKVEHSMTPKTFYKYITNTKH